MDYCESSLGNFLLVIVFRMLLFSYCLLCGE